MVLPSSQLLGVSGAEVLCGVLRSVTGHHTIELQDLLYGDHSFGRQRFKFPFCSLMGCIKILVETMKIKCVILRSLHIVLKYCLVSISFYRSVRISAAYWPRN